MKRPGTSNKKTGNQEYLKDITFTVKAVRCFSKNNGPDDVVFDMELNGVTIYGCRVVEGKNGDFISFPSRKGSDGKYYSIAYAPLDSDTQNTILKEVERRLNE